MNVDKRKRKSNWIAYAAAALLLVGSGYVWGYFLLSVRQPMPTFEVCVRVFRQGTLRKAFGLMGWIEAQVRGETVFLFSQNDEDTVDDYRPIW